MLEPTIEERMRVTQDRLNAYIEDRGRTLTRLTDEEYLRNLERGIAVVSSQQMSRAAYMLYAKAILMQYYCEYWGAWHYENAYRRGMMPRVRSCPQIFERMYREEYRHAHLVWFGDGKGNPGPLSVLPIDPTLFFAERPEEQVNMLHIFRHQGFSRWSEVIVYNHFQDRAALLQLLDFAQGPFEPWSKILHIIDSEEAEHIRHGEAWFSWIAETAAGRQVLQEDINKWFSHAMDVFGHPGQTSKTQELMLKFGIKRKTNDEARKEFVRAVSPLIERHGSALPRWEYQENRPFA